MKTRSIRLWVVAGVLGLAAVCLIVGGALYATTRVRLFSSRPLVLIHSPRNNEQMRAGEATAVHVTARADNGLRRIELWADQRLIAAREAPAETEPTNLVLTTSWTPRIVGDHVLVARAVAANGIEGQSSVVVRLLASDETQPVGLHTVQDGETLESIADEYGTTPEDLAALNPGLGPDGPAPGEDLVVPDTADEPSGGDQDLGGGDPPTGQDAAPDSLDVVVRLFGIQPRPGLGADDSAPRGLRIEVLELTTGDAYEALHCYISLAGQDPRWVPDADIDPATDESFASLGARSWDVAAHLAGDAAPVVVWPGDQALPANVSCVGVLSGGTDSHNLGQLELAIPPTEWDGLPHPADAAGPDGSFALAYRVTSEPATPHGVPLELDPAMATPYNVRLHHGRLAWDYPTLADEPIDGFYILLEGNLQWTEPARARESRLPHEWFYPPCDTVYNFAVVAWRLEGGQSYESNPGTTLHRNPDEDCHREIQITFLALETFNLGGDGSHEDRHGDVGPVYGAFTANERQIRFDARSTGARGTLDMPNGLSHNTTYDLAALAADSSWHFTGETSLVVEVGEGGMLEFGYSIMDEDTGRCRDSDDPGCDDLVCEGTSDSYWDDDYGTLDAFYEGSLLSENGRCRVTYVFGPAWSSPVGTGTEGEVPLPWIEVEDVFIDETTGGVRIHVRNGGTAAWPWRDLEVELQTRSGDSYGIYTFPDFELEAGQRAVLEHPDMVLAAPFDACIVIDPNDAVPEWFEHTGVFLHHPICPQLPDLVIASLEFDAAGAGHLRATVQNVGVGAVESRTIQVRGRLEDGRSMGINRSWPGIDLEPGEAVVFDMAGVSESMRRLMADGYSLTVDPDRAIAEVRDDNNTFRVRGSSQLEFWWCDTVVPHYFGRGHTVRMDLALDAVLGSETRRLHARHVEDELPYLAADTREYHYVVGDAFPGLGCVHEGTFELTGDEWLQVTVSGEFQGGHAGGWEDLGRGTMVLDPNDDWGAAPPSACLDRTHTIIVVPDMGMLAPEPWTSTFAVCLPEE